MAEWQKREFDPEHWEGHQRGDSCPRPRAPFPYSPRFLATIKEDLAEQSQTRPLVKQFRKTPDKRPVVSLANGEVFDAGTLPPGTIFRFDQEVYSLRDTGDGWYRQASGLGVSFLSRTGETKVRKYVDDGNWGDSRPPQIKIGAVEHEAEKDLSSVVTILLE